EVVETGSVLEPTNYDTDGDGLADSELLNNDFELTCGTNPLLDDTDGDGLLDGEEATLIVESIEESTPQTSVQYESSTAFTDAIAGIGNSEEDEPIELTKECEVDYDTPGCYLCPYDPTDPDMDKDELDDGQEDTNKDGVVDVGETDPRNPDSDGDHLLDGQEDTNKNGVVDAGETDPNNDDSDDDGITDYMELKGTAVWIDEFDNERVDFEHEELNDLYVMCNEEYSTCITNPNKPDTDGDYINDNIELSIGTDPREKNEDVKIELDWWTDCFTNKIPTIAECKQSMLDIAELDVAPDDYDVYDWFATDRICADEVDRGIGVFCTDTDNDGLLDRVEISIGTNLANSDSDKDGLPDGLEYEEDEDDRILDPV
ncbi:MAG: hypothetical protein QF535_20585, partial [Anaerolineales bacterium]|nr:hypothetical protein [Anaerolineales bacterium]